MYEIKDELYRLKTILQIFLPKKSGPDPTLPNGFESDRIRIHVEQMEFYFIWKGKCSWNISIKINLKTHPPFPDYQWRATFVPVSETGFVKAGKFLPAFLVGLKNGGPVRRNRKFYAKYLLFTNVFL